MSTPHPFFFSHRDVDGVEADLRRKIADHLPPIDDEHDPLAAKKPRYSDAAESGGDQQSQGVSLPPATLAKALPHIRRLMPPVGGGGMLALLKGGGLVFPDKPSNTPPLKQGEVRIAQVKQKIFEVLRYLGVMILSQHKKVESRGSSYSR